MTPEPSLPGAEIGHFWTTGGCAGSCLHKSSSPEEYKLLASAMDSLLRLLLKSESLGGNDKPKKLQIWFPLNAVLHCIASFCKLNFSNNGSNHILAVHSSNDPKPSEMMKDSALHYVMC